MKHHARCTDCGRPETLDPLFLVKQQGASATVKWQALCAECLHEKSKRPAREQRERINKAVDARWQETLAAQRRGGEVSDVARHTPLTPAEALGKLEAAGSQVRKLGISVFTVTGVGPFASEGWLAVLDYNALHGTVQTVAGWRKASALTQWRQDVAMAARSDITLNAGAR
jgi:hypothetical protein